MRWTVVIAVAFSSLGAMAHSEEPNPLHGRWQYEQMITATASVKIAQSWDGAVLEISGSEWKSTVAGKSMVFTPRYNSKVGYTSIRLIPQSRIGDEYTILFRIKDDRLQLSYLLHHNVPDEFDRGIVVQFKSKK